MSSIITTVISFKIEILFEECIKIFDSKEANNRHYEFDIKPLLRVFSKDDTKKNFLYTLSYRSKYKMFFQANSEWIKSKNIDF